MSFQKLCAKVERVTRGKRLTCGMASMERNIFDTFKFVHRVQKRKKKIILGGNSLYNGGILFVLICRPKKKHKSQSECS